MLNIKGYFCSTPSTGG